MNTVQNTPQLPWWKHGHLWLVIGGPAVVVVASFFTLFLAIRTPDPVYQDAPGSRAGAPPADEVSSAHGSAHAPVMQARNHAATGGVPPAAQNQVTNDPAAGR